MCGCAIAKLLPRWIGGPTLAARDDDPYLRLRKPRKRALELGGEAACAPPTMPCSDHIAT
jgi:hypothetical protein